MKYLQIRKKKSAYDQFGHAGVDQSMGGGPGGGFQGGFSDFGDAFGDIFGDIFGGGRSSSGRSNVYRGADLRYNLEISLEEAAHGTEKKIRIPVLSNARLAPDREQKKEHNQHMWNVWWSWSSSNATRILFCTTNLSKMSGVRQSDQ